MKEIIDFGEFLKQANKGSRVTFFLLPDGPTIEGEVTKIMRVHPGKHVRIEPSNGRKFYQFASFVSDINEEAKVIEYSL